MYEAINTRHSRIGRRRVPLKTTNVVVDLKRHYAVALVMDTMCPKQLGRVRCRDRSINVPHIYILSAALAPPCRGSMN